jgi:hypothetical protein
MSLDISPVDGLDRCNMKFEDFIRACDRIVVRIG